MGTTDKRTKTRSLLKDHQVAKEDEEFKCHEEHCSKDPSSMQGTSREDSSNHKQADRIDLAQSPLYYDETDSMDHPMKETGWKRTAKNITSQKQAGAGNHMEKSATV